jgi:hypothetical protein
METRISDQEFNAILEGHALTQVAKEIQRWPVNTNRGSEIAYPCPNKARYLVLLRKHWSELPPITPELEELFAEGHMHEKQIADRLENRYGWEIWKPRKSLEWKQYQITGTLDREGRPPAPVCQQLGLDPEGVYPIEIKALEPHSWGKIGSIGDLLNAKQPWLRKYPGQLLIYLLLTESTTGIFVIKNKVSGKLKYLPLHLYEWLDYGTRLLNLCQEVNQHIANGTEPDVTDYEEAACGRCDLQNICMPGEVGAGAIPLIDDETELAIQRWEELKPLAAEYKKLDDEIKDPLKKFYPCGSNIVCGDFQISITECKKTLQAQPERTQTYPVVRIKRLKGER